MLKVNKVSFFWQWVTAVTIILIPTLMVALTTMWSIGEEVANAVGETVASSITGGVFGALFGAGLGLSQAIVLRSQGVALVPWLLRTIVAATLGTALIFTLMNVLNGFDMPQTVMGLLLALAMGVPIGLGQQPVLKSFVRPAQLWPLVCTIAFMISFAIGFSLGGEGREWLAISATAILMATISGAGMVWLLRGEETALAA